MSQEFSSSQAGHRPPEHQGYRSNSPRSMTDESCPSREEAVGTGTTVLPREEPRKGTCSSGAQIRTILLVEDDQLVRTLVCRILCSQKFQVIEADDGKEAVEKAERHAEPIDLIIADLNLPTLGGLEVVRRVNRMHPESKVLLVSGYADDAEEQSETVETVHSRYPLLLKPFTVDTLLDRIRGILGRG